MINYVSLFIFTLSLIASSIAYAEDRFLPIEEIKTPQGISAWLVTDKTLPILSINFVFEGAGAKNNSKEQQGVAMLLSNMLDEGAGDLTSQQFQKKLSDQSISLSFSSTRDNFSGRLTTLTRYQDNAVELLKLAIEDPRFDPEPLERMRQANLTRVKSSMGNPNWIAQRIFNDTAFEGHPYALNSGGTISSLNQITAVDLKEFKKEYLTKDRLKIGVAGNITKEELITILDKLFGNLENKSSKITEDNFPLKNTGKAFLYKKDIPQSIIIQAIESIPVSDPDYAALQVLNYIFGSSGFGSRLMTEAREKRGLTYGIYSSLSHMDEIDLLEISTSTDNGNATKMLGIIHQEIEKVLENIDGQEIKDAKSYLIGSLPLALTSTAQIADIVTSLQLNDRPVDYLDTYNERITRITKKDLKRVAERVFKDSSPITIIVGQPENIEKLTIIENIPNAE